MGHPANNGPSEQACKGDVRYGDQFSSETIDIHNCISSATNDEARFQPPIRTSSRKPYIQLDRDDDGNPLLPDIAEWPSKGMDKKALIRSYVGAAYREWVRNYALFIA